MCVCVCVIPASEMCSVTKLLGGGFPTSDIILMHVDIIYGTKLYIRRRLVCRVLYQKTQSVDEEENEEEKEQKSS